MSPKRSWPKFPALFALAAALIRLLQGSATVAMITAAGLTAPLITPIFRIRKGPFCFGHCCGASILSHVNDTGFWLVSKYLGMDEKQTFRSWSISTLLIALADLAGFVCCGFWFSLFPQGVVAFPSGIVGALIGVGTKKIALCLN